MTDIIDRAAEREEQFRRAALDAHQRRAAGARRSADAPVTHCCLCDEPIPAARLRALPGVETCVDCQQMLERGLLA